MDLYDYHFIQNILITQHLPGLNSSEDHSAKRKEGPEEVKPDNVTEEKTTRSPYGSRQTFFQGSKEVKSVWKPLNKAGESVAVF